MQIAAPSTPAATWLSGSGVPSSGLGSNGDLYFRTATGDTYFKSGGSWSLALNLVGPQGATGATGGAGATGAAGSNGATWLSGSGVPSGGSGANGDFYLRTSNGDVYTKSAGTWSVTGNILGPTGATGSAGSTGAAGSNGAPGAVWRSGSGAPSNGTGIDGDYYLRTSNGDVYLRSGGTYSVVGNILGPTGATGSTGAAGSNGTNGTNGVDGAPAYPDPGINKLITWTHDPANDTGSLALVSGSVYMLKVPVFGVKSVTNIRLYVVTGGGTLTSSQNFAALFSEDGQTRVGVSADLSGVWNTSGDKTIPLVSGPFNIGTAGVLTYFYIALLGVGTTGPAILRQGNTFPNVGMAQADRYRFGIGPTSQTSMPGTVTTTTLTRLDTALQAGLS
jgi:hypothetical protein